MTLYEDLCWRGLIKDISSPDLIEKINKGGLTFYIGTDPTADSMHLGHLSSFLISTRLKKAGHNPILLIGGATGRIGDPRPTTEREMKSIEEVEKNIEGLTKQAKEIFGFKVVNNYDWSKDINFIDFLRDYGKFFNINYMLDKDIIRRRLETGITYTEFSYMIMQALDFLHLYEKENCIILFENFIIIPLSVLIIFFIKIGLEFALIFTLGFILSFSENSKELIKSNSSLIDILVNSVIFLSPTVTANASGFNLAPLHFGHGLSLIYFSTSDFIISEFVSIYLLFKLFISPSK